MKKTICTLFGLGSFLIVPAQPTISNMFNYPIGSTQKMRNCAAANVTPGNGGANVAWFYTTLQVTDTITTDIVDPVSTPYAASFPAAAYAARTQGGDYRFVKRNIFTGHVDHLLMGAADSASGMVITYPDQVFLCRAPFTFNDSAYDQFTVAYGNVSGAGELSMLADGYGTLHLSVGTFVDVLRIKTVYHEMDTIISGPALITIDLVAVKYDWYDALHAAPLMTWDSTQVVSTAGSSSSKTVQYLQGEVIAGIGSPDRQTLDFTANLRNDELMIQGRFQQDRKYTLSLFGANGQQLYGESRSVTGSRYQAHIDRALPAGLYLLRIADEKNAPQTIKLINQ